MVLAVCRERSSPEAMSKQLLSTKVWDPSQLGDWLRTEWGPKALMSVDATLAIRGARPVAFEQPSVQAEASGQLGSLRWETLEDDGIKVAGRLSFTVSDNVLRATRDGPRELSGEAELVEQWVLHEVNAEYARAKATGWRRLLPCADDASADAATDTESRQWRRYRGEVHGREEVERERPLARAVAQAVAHVGRLQQERASARARRPT